MTGQLSSMSQQMNRHTALSLKLAGLEQAVAQLSWEPGQLVDQAVKVLTSYLMPTIWLASGMACGYMFARSSKSKA